MIHSDICIAGAGIIGLSLALELHTRGLSVIVLESGTPMQQASTAAAGMLAADDPHNPSELAALSHLSLSLYPSFLERIHSLTGVALPFQTNRTLQALTHATSALAPQLQAELLIQNDSNTAVDPAFGFTLLHEHSIDPRQLAPALIAAIASTSIRTLYDSPIMSIRGGSVDTAATSIHAGHFIDCTGAWASAREPDSTFTTFPIKGQMLALNMPPDLQLKTVLRTEDFYIVPRTIGPNAGRIIIGATIEDAGFDKTVQPTAIESLRQRAISLIPALADASVSESWAGLRPATPDRLPILGAHLTRPHQWIATGHYRNGILLAPATAKLMADLVLGHAPSISLEAFSPSRLAIQAATSIQ